MIKRILLFTALLFVGFTSFSQTDTQAPVLNSVSFSPVPATNGDSLEVTLNVTDNLSGVGFIALFFRSPGGSQSGSVQGSRWTKKSNAVFTAKIKINDYAESGKWFVSDLQIADVASNTLNKHTTASDTIATFQVNSNNEDITTPQLKSIGFEPQPVANGDSLEITLNVKDDNSGVNFIAMFLRSPGGSQANSVQGGFWIKKNDSVFTTKIKVNDYAENGKWFVSDLTIADVAHNTWRRSTTSGDTIASFRVNSSNEDVTAPQLKSINFNPPVVANGDSLEITLNVKDDNSGIKFIAVFLRSPKAGQNNGAQGQKWVKKNDSVFVAKIKINEFAENGKWFVSSLTIADVADNTLNKHTNTNDTIATFLVDSVASHCKHIVYDTVRVVVYDTVRVQITDTVLVTLVDSTGLVSGIQATADITASLYPNPANKHVTVEAPLAIRSIYIVNSQGVAQKNIVGGSKKISFDLGGLPVGNYTLIITTAKGIVTRKLILLE